jgi:hypothetical protein
VKGQERGVMISLFQALEWLDADSKAKFADEIRDLYFVKNQLEIELTESFEYLRDVIEDISAQDLPVSLRDICEYFYDVLSNV